MSDKQKEQFFIKAVQSLASEFGFKARKEGIQLTIDLQSIDMELVHKVLEHLNCTVDSKYKVTTKTTQRAITSLINKGYILKDFIDVINSKADQWLDDPKMSQYLTPSTLFAASNFEKYLMAARRQPTSSMYNLMKDDWA